MKDFIALDFETATGKRNSMCAIGLVVVKENIIIEKYFALVKPPENIHSEFNSYLNNIFPEHTETAPTFPDLYQKLRSYLNGKTVVCHNSDFDIDVLFQTMNYYGINDSLTFEVKCTMKLYGGSGLDICCMEHGIPLDHHNPLSDAEACAYLYMKHSSDFTDFQFKKRQRQFTQTEHEKICGDVLKKDLINVENKENYFYNKKTVITGVFKNWPDRTLLACIIKKLGSDIDTGITAKTNILICGTECGPSKLEKMKRNISDGKDAAILYEDDIIRIFNEINIKY